MPVLEPVRAHFEPLARKLLTLDAQILTAAEPPCDRDCRGCDQGAISCLLLLSTAVLRSASKRHP